MSGAVERVRVGDILKLERLEVAIEPDREYQLVGVYSFGRGLFHREPVVGADLGDYRFFEIRPDRLVVSNIQAWEGALAISTEADAGIVGTHRFLSYSAIDPEQVDIRWVRWFFLSEPGMTLIRQAAPGTAVRNRTLARKRFEDLVIPLPSLAQQKRVARLIGDVAARASQLRGRLKRADELALAAQINLTRQPLRAVEWQAKTLDEVAAVSTESHAVLADRSYGLAGVYSFGKGVIDRGTIQGDETAYRTFTRLEAGNVVMSKLNGWEGAVAVVGDSHAGLYVSSEFPTFVLDERQLSPAYFQGIARSPKFWAQLNKNVRGSMVRRRRIKADDFLSATIEVPPLGEQHRRAKLIAALDLRHVRAAQLARTDSLVHAVLNREFGAIS